MIDSNKSIINKFYMYIFDVFVYNKYLAMKTNFYCFISQNIIKYHYKIFALEYVYWKYLSA